MRYRSLLSPDKFGYHRVTTTSYPSGAVMVNANENWKVTRDQSLVTNDEVISGYRKRSRNGEIFNNPYSSVNVLTTMDDVYTSFIEQYAPRNSGGAMTSREDNLWQKALLDEVLKTRTFPTVSLDTEAARASSRLQSISNINKTVFDAGTFLGEWSKTKTIHRDVCNAIIEVMVGGKPLTRRPAKYRKVPLYDEKGSPVLTRKGFPVYRFIHEPGGFEGQGRFQSAKNLSNAYLVGRYGVGPLLKDLEDAVKFLLQGKNPPRFTARGTATIQGQASGTTTLSDFASAWNISLQTTRTFTVRNGVLYTSSPLMRSLAQLGVTRPLSVAWELVPWSFVIDWIVDVGGWLDAVQPNASFQNLCAWESTQDVTVQSASVSQTLTRVRSSSTTVATNYGVATWNGGWVKITTVKSRNPWSIVLPRAPSLGSGLTSLRSLDLAALVAQQVRTRFNRS